jgi:hypothetical protein
MIYLQNRQILILSKLKIILDKKYYKSDSTNNGRIIARFFENLSTNIFNQAYKYSIENHKITGRAELPLIFGERNIYSTIAVAINEITPIHISEWAFNPSEHTNIEKSRRVDFWCLNRDSEKGNPINYFIEVKKGWYCLNKASKEAFQTLINKGIIDLIQQTKDLKNISPEWDDVDDVFLGISIIHGYYDNDKLYYNEHNIRENIYNELETDSNLQLITSTWHIPSDLEPQWDKSKCKFITISGIVTNKSSDGK